MTPTTADEGSDSHDRATLKQGGAAVHLQLAGNRIALKVFPAGNASAPTTIEVGSLQPVLDILAHEPATAREIEAAIVEVEDLLTPGLALARGPD